MKDYLKPAVEIVNFAVENIANIDTTSDQEAGGGIVLPTEAK